MPLLLTKEGMRAIFPKAPTEVIDAFVRKQRILDKAGITANRRRLAWFLANLEHECDGFNVNGFVKNLTENIEAYTHERMAEVWPNRFANGHAVRMRFGTGPGWQKKAFDQIYGNRMGNRPGTSDGSMFIGRGGPQWTGRDGYEALARILPTLIFGTGKMTAEQAVGWSTRLEYQPEVCTAFWIWKNLNVFADANNWTGLVKAWNGGTNGMADRQAKMAGNDPHIKRLAEVAQKTETVEALPEKPKAAPPPAVPKPTTPATPPAKPATPARDAATGAVVVGGAAAAGAGAWWGDWLSAGLTFGIVAMVVATVIIILRRRK